MENQTMKCNQCGKAFSVRSGVLCEDGLFVTKEWGYFSDKDLKVHKFRLCENCYDKMIQGFVLPVEVTDKSTVMD